MPPVVLQLGSVGLFSVFNTLGRLAVGFLSDRYHAVFPRAAWLVAAALLMVIGQLYTMVASEEMVSLICVVMDSAGGVGGQCLTEDMGGVGSMTLNRCTEVRRFWAQPTAPSFVWRRRWCQSTLACHTLEVSTQRFGIACCALWLKRMPGNTHTLLCAVLASSKLGWHGPGSGDWQRGVFDCHCRQPVWQWFGGCCFVHECTSQGVLVVAYVVYHSFSHYCGTRKPCWNTPDAYRWTLLIQACACVLSVLAAFTLYRRRRNWVPPGMENRHLRK